MTTEITDSIILSRFRVDPEDGFRHLVEKYQECLYFHIRRIVIVHQDADDALQNCFIKAWENLGRFRKASSLYTWLYRIATNEALGLLKKKNRAAVNNIDELFGAVPEGDTWFDGDKAEKILQNAILSLPEKQRLVFLMRYYDGMKYEEISKVLKRTVGTLKANYHHAVKKIEDYVSTH